MKRLICVVLLLCPLGAGATKRDWRDADVLKITYHDTSGGAAAVPIGTMVVAVPIRRQTVYYSIATTEIVYVLALTNKKPLNITLHGKTKIAIDGDKAHILDDAGKDIKVPIVGKVARQSVEVNQTQPEQSQAPQAASQREF